MMDDNDNDCNDDEMMMPPWPPLTTLGTLPPWSPWAPLPAYTPCMCVYMCVFVYTNVYVALSIKKPFLYLCTPKCMQKSYFRVLKQIS